MSIEGGFTLFSFILVGIVLNYCGSAGAKGLFAAAFVYGLLIIYGWETILGSEGKFEYRFYLLINSSSSVCDVTVPHWPVS